MNKEPSKSGGSNGGSLSSIITFPQDERARSAGCSGPRNQCPALGDPALEELHSALLDFDGFDRYSPAFFGAHYFCHDSFRLRLRGV